MRRFVPWIPCVVYMALIFYSSSRPPSAVSRVVWDKALHAGGFAVLALLFCRALRASAIAPGSIVLGAVLLTSVYGGIDEWHQTFVPSRSADVADWVADTIGAAAAAALYAGVSTASRRRRPLPR